MVRWLICGLSVGVVGLTVATAEAHLEFKNMFEKEYDHLKVTCNACHIQGKPKEERNDFGSSIQGKVASEGFSAKLKEIKDRDEKKKFMEETVLPAIKKSLKEVVDKEKNDDGESWADLIKEGRLPGTSLKD